MKKSISIIILLFVAFFSVNASAQSSKLVGTWVGEGEYDAQMNATAVPTLIFKANNTGSITMSYEMSSALDETSSLMAKIKINVPMRWSYSNSTINGTFNTESTTINIDELKVASQDPYVEELMQSYIPQLKQMLLGEFNKAKQKLPKTDSFKVVSITGNTLTLIQEGKQRTYIRK